MSEQRIIIGNNTDQEEITILLDHENIAYEWETENKLKFNDEDYVRITELLDDNDLDYCVI